MKDMALSSARTDEQVAPEVFLLKLTLRAGLVVFFMVLALIGIWAITALVAGAVLHGPVDMARGWLESIRGF